MYKVGPSILAIQNIEIGDSDLVIALSLGI